MVRIALIGIAGVLMALQLKALKSEYAVYLCLGVSLLIFLYVTEQLQVIVEGLEAIQDSLPLNTGYIRTLMKIIGITYIAEFASDLCKDAGYQTIAGQIQIFGKLSVLTISIPILTALLDTIRTFLGG
jgi:stage III sporulation protein AD